MKLKDERIKLMNEVLNGIKVYECMEIRNEKYIIKIMLHIIPA